MMTGDESESSISLSELELGELGRGSVIVIFILVTVPKKSISQVANERICFLRKRLTVKERYKLRRALKANCRKRAVEK